MLGSLLQKRGVGLFLLVVVPAAVFIGLYRNELSLLAGPVLLVLGLVATVISFVPNWVGTDPATGNAPPASGVSVSLMLGGLLATLFGLMLSLLLLMTPPPAEAVSRAALALLCQGVGFALVFGLFMVALPRFVLPTQTRAERRQVRGRLWLYLLGMHGPVVLVKNGQQAASGEEAETHFKPSVALLDTVSAIALERKFPVPQPTDPRRWRTSLAEQLYELEKYLARQAGHGPGEVVAAGLYWARWLRLAPGRALRQWLLRHRLIRPRPVKPPRLSRVEGPGLVFIQADEMVRDTLDLRTQSRARSNVQALTRDGIEVQAAVSVKFRLHGEAARDLTEHTEAIERNRPAFTFNRESAFRAVYGSPVAKFKMEAEALEVKHWTDLPAFVAADIFRDLILSRTLDNLFLPTSDTGFPLADLRRDFSEKVKTDLVLIERGIQVESADFGRLTLPEKVVEQRVDSWRTDWVRRSVENLAAGDLEAVRIIHRARTEAQFDLIRQISAALQESGSAATVLLRSLQTMERASADPRTRSLLPVETVQTLNSWVNQLSRSAPPAEK